jgi:chromosome segregation ATPase
MGLDLAIDMSFEDDEDDVGEKQSPRRQQQQQQHPQQRPQDQLLREQLEKDKKEHEAEKARMQESLSSALAQLDSVCKEHDKQSTIYAVTRKEMFLAQEQVDELSYKLSSVKEMNSVLKENMETLSQENQHKDQRIERVTHEYSELSNKLAVQVKMNNSLTAQLEKLEQIGKSVCVCECVCVAWCDDFSDLTCHACILMA